MFDSPFAMYPAAADTEGAEVDVFWTEEDDA